MDSPGWFQLYDYSEVGGPVVPARRSSALINLRPRKKCSTSRSGYSGFNLYKLLSFGPVQCSRARRNLPNWFMVRGSVVSSL
jgi:hypothetical protein